MKKLLILLPLATALLAVPVLAQQAAPAAAPATAAPAPQKKVIQDPGEHNAYMAAMNTSDAKQKAQMLESYLQTYPNSIMRVDGMETLLKTYQQLNDAVHIKSTAQKLLQLDANNLTALALLSFLDRAQAQQGGPDAAVNLQQAGQLGATGLKTLETANKPEGYTDEQWNNMKGSFRVIFLISVGHAALQSKDYAVAQANLKEAVALQPGDVSTIYLLALSYLSPKPPVVDGLFWIAKAANAAPQLHDYAKNQYIRYHGGDQGFEELLATAKSAPTIPAGFTVAPAPSAADQAHDMLKKGAPETLSFAEWQFILSNGSKEDVAAVWTAIKGKPVPIIANLIEGTTSSLKLAGSLDDIDAKKSDITLILKVAIKADQLPKPGSELTFTGVPSDYTVNGDNFNMILSEGEVVKGLEAAKPAAKKPAAGVHKKAAQ